MNHQHILFINGLYVTLWGPMSRQNTLVLFMKTVAKQYNQSYVDIAFGLQLSEEFQIVKDPIRAYWAWIYISSYINQKKCNITLKNDDFLSSSPLSLRPTPPPRRSKENTILDRLTETVLSRRKSSLVGTMSVSPPSRRWWEVFHFQRLMPALQTSIFLLVIGTIFGSLILPLR